jgi:hypothetical protein
VEGSDLRADRAARNEALFRRVNERVEEVNRAFDPILDDADFVCECADVECMDRIRMTLEAYEAVRAEPTRFVVKPGHVLPAEERVVEELRGYIVVEKIGHAGERAAELDPRDQNG